MFEISWSELLILALVTLVCVGPKELPALFNTIGRYVGMMRRQAAEFRKHFEDAMQEAEFDRINKEVMQLGDQVNTTVREAGALAEKEVAATKATVAAAAAAGENTRAPETESTQAAVPSAAPEKASQP